MHVHAAAQLIPPSLSVTSEVGVLRRAIVQGAGRQHERFAAVLREHGVELLDLRALLADVLGRERADGLTGRRLVGDAAAWIHDGVVLARPASRHEVVFRHHPRFAGRAVWSDGLGRRLPIAGGDVLVLGERCVVIGSAGEAVRRLAARLFAGSRVTSVIAVRTPRGAPPLGALLAMVDRDAFVVAPGVRAALRAFTLRPVLRGVEATPEDDLATALARALDLPGVRMLEAEPDVLALAPGVVVGHAPDARLRNAGVDVIPVPRAARGRGPRALCCPIEREPRQP